MSQENLTLFAHCFEKGHPKLQIDSLQIMGDVLLTHGISVLTGPTSSMGQRQCHKLLARATRFEERDEIQATAVEIICKLMLLQVLKDSEVNTPSLLTVRLSN